MEKYIVTLHEPYSNSMYYNLKSKGFEVIWASEFLPNLIAVESEKSIKELKKLKQWIKNANENINGHF